jgi:phytoene synthase
MESAVSASYETCRRLHRRYDPTYYWAARRLPPDVRPATHALYGYVRTADEIVDGPGRAATPAARLAELDAWEAELDRGLEAGESSHPVVGALVDAGWRHRLPLGELHAYMGSMRRDCAPVRMLTWEELCGYMDGSAGTVGRIMAPLLGVPERHHADYGRLGLAFQLTNFLRDLREDYGLDRVYLPLEDRERFGVVEADLAGERSSGELRDLVAFEARRARELFSGAEDAIAATPGSARTGVRLACAAYERVLHRVERIDVLGRRAGLRAWMLPGVVARALHR